MWRRGEVTGKGLSVCARGQRDAKEGQCRNGHMPDPLRAEGAHSGKLACKKGGMLRWMC